MPTTYTLTTGEQRKLLATRDGATRTVTAVRGLDAADAAELAHQLGQVELLLTLWTSDPETFAGQATRLGLRRSQVTDGRTLTVSAIADRPAPAGPVPHGPDTFRIQPLARICQLADRLPTASARAVRAELRELLAAFDGPLVTATVADLDGPVTVNAALWCRDATAADLGDVLIGGWPDNDQALEQLAWYYSAAGAALERSAHDRVAAQADLDVTLDLGRLVDRLAVVRPRLLADLVAEADRDDLALEPDQRAAVDRARTLLSAR